MAVSGFSINEAARELGVSTRTVRRFIKAGKLKAELIEGVFGPEYRINELPPELQKNAAVQPEAEAEPVEAESESQEAPEQLISLVKELQEKNLALAAQLGAASERIRTLEGQVKLLAAPKLPWWKRVFKNR